MDLRAVNKAIIPIKYPLPTTEELTAQFYRSTGLSSDPAASRKSWPPSSLGSQVWPSTLMTLWFTGPHLQCFQCSDQAPPHTPMSSTSRVPLLSRRHVPTSLEHGGRPPCPRAHLSFSGGLLPGHDGKHDLILLLHTPLQETVSLKKLQDASADNPSSLHSRPPSGDAGGRRCLTTCSLAIGSGWTDWMTPASSMGSAPSSCLTFGHVYLLWGMRAT